MRDDELTQADDSRDTAVVASCVIAVVFVLVYMLSRRGFDTPLAPVVNALGVSLFLIAAPRVIARVTDQGRDAPWWMSQPALALMCIVAVTLAGMLTRATGFRVSLVFVAAGFVLALVTFAGWLVRGTVARSLGLVFGVAIFALWCAGVMWGSRYKMPLFWETLSFDANIHHDTFYYASMANMLDTYGIPSTGLDGVPLIRYHFGSTWLYAQWSHLIGTDVLTFYSLAYPVIVLPLFFSALLLFSSRLGASLRTSGAAWIVLLAATVGFLPSRALYDVGVWNANAFISESYLIGMAVLFFLLGSALAYWQSGGVSPRRVSAYVFLLLLAPAAILVLGMLKISLMILVFSLAIYLSIRLGLFRRPIVLASSALCLIALLFTFALVNLPAQNLGIVPLDFLRHNNGQGWQQFFPLVHLLWTWVYLAGRVWEEGARDLRSLSIAVREGRLIDAEALAVIALVGFLPGEILRIYGGSAIYFSDVQRWVALSLIMGRIGLWIARRKPAPSPQGIRLSAVLAVFVLAPLVVSLFVNVAQISGRMVRTNLALRRDLAHGSAYKPIVTALRDIARLPREERRRSLLFIPQTNTQYWSMFTADGRCTFTPLIAPGIASVALLDGMPPYGCTLTDQYNMTSYNPRMSPQKPSDVSDQALCTRARAKGFTEVIVLDAKGTNVPDRRRIDCYLPSS
jgi:hypothetical protein